MPKSPLTAAFLRFIGLVAIYTLSRWVFYLFNAAQFPDPNIHVWLQGVRFDIVIILLLNCLYFIPNLIPCSFIKNRIFRKIEDWLMVIVNAIALLINLIDTCYYPFSMRRMTGDIFGFIGETNNFGELIPVFLRDYFYMIFIWIGFILLLMGLIYLTNKIDYQEYTFKGKGLWAKILLRLIVLFLMITGLRGGWQYRPLNVAAAAQVNGIGHAALVLNSPYSLLSTLSSERLDRKQYLSDEECAALFSTHQTNFTTGTFTPPETENVVLIILEGISSEYSTYLADEPKQMAGFTPFLDSLAQHSIVFRGLANGQQSIEALSSIMGGLPSLMSRPFSQSSYATNQIDYALPKLKQRGMHTMFFHGGRNGTMGFDRYCKLVGIDDYYGLNEYSGPQSDFDGTWGIADQPYLQYFAHTLDAEKQPFFAAVFTLSSHHPFVVPEPYDKMLPHGEFPMQHTVAYTDMALRDFFAMASQSDWYDKTLFIITADHTNFKDASFIDYQKHRYAVPMIFYHPLADTIFRSQRIMQQADIMPTIFAYCGINEDFTSFGRNAFDDEAVHFAINKLSGMYQFYIDHYLIEFDGLQVRYIWDLSTEPHRTAMSADAVPEMAGYEKLLKSIIQQFNNGLLKNELK
ncbi:MAG: LTA synthase family protein [Bacteroidales bacterium]|nr:LTA synthase family protein [Bacteroidales bacterium]